MSEETRVGQVWRQVGSAERLVSVVRVGTLELMPVVEVRERESDDTELLDEAGFGRLYRRVFDHAKGAVPRAASNCFVLLFDAEGRCTEFTFMKRPR